MKRTLCESLLRHLRNFSLLPMSECVILSWKWIELFGKNWIFKWYLLVKKFQFKAFAKTKFFLENLDSKKMLLKFRSLPRIRIPFFQFSLLVVWVVANALAPILVENKPHGTWALMRQKSNTLPISPSHPALLVVYNASNMKKCHIRIRANGRKDPDFNDLSESGIV